MARWATSGDHGRNRWQKACDNLHDSQPSYQGLFPAALYRQLRLAGDSFTPDGLEFYGKISFLRAGIRYGDRLTTVSPTYAQEILTTKYGCGLAGQLQHRTQDLVGILNGADYRI